MTLRRVVRSLVIILFALGVALSLVTPATATPVTGKSTSPVSYAHRASVSKAQMKGLRIARTVVLKDTKGKVLDYKKAKKHWGKHTTYRRQFAGAWIAAGGKVTHISKKERKKVNRWVLRAPVPAANGMHAQARHCTGRTAYYWVPWTNYYYYDSCRTNDFQRNAAFCMTGAGFAAAALPNPGAAVTISLLIAGCATTATWINSAQQNSDVNAIIVVTQRGYDYSRGRYVAPVRIEPQ